MRFISKNGQDSKNVFWNELLGIFLLSLAVLLFQVTTTKIIEYSMWANYAFLIICTAMFGIGVSGVIITRWPQLLQVSTGTFFSCCAFASGIFIAVAFVTINNVPIHLPSTPNGLSKEILNLSIVFVALGIPFLFFGFIISTIFEKKGGRAGLYYSVDLIGASIGCLVLLALIKHIAPQGLILLSIIVSFVAGFIFLFSHNGRILQIAPVLGVLITIIIGLAFIPKIKESIPLNVHVEKRSYTRDLQKNRIEATNWSPLSRVDVAKMSSWQKRVWIAGGVNESSIIKFDGDFEKARKRRDEVLEKSLQSINYQAFPHFFKNNHTVCMIGTSGGNDSLFALYMGARNVVGVEMDPGVASMVIDTYRDYAGGLFTDGKYSELAIDEGRSYLRRTDRKFDVIQQVNNFTPIAFMNGALNLSETYLLTVESFKDFYEHLSDDGILSISRYGSFKLLTTAIGMFRKMGLKPEEYSKHLMVIEGPRPIIPTLLMKKSAFTEEEVTSFRDWFYRMGKRRSILYAPYIDTPENYYSAVVTAEDPASYYHIGAFDLSPSTDNRPFFNHIKTLGIKDTPALANPLLPDEIRSIEPRNVFHDRIPRGDIPVISVLLIAFLMSSVFFILPMFTKKELRDNLKSERRTLVYFACLGLGFIFVEICLIQRLVLFLGHPVYSISAVLSSLLLSAGIGSLVSQRISSTRKSLYVLLIAIGVIIVAMHLTLPLLSEVFVKHSIVVRMCVAIIYIAVSGFFMGMPMPLGIRYLNKHDRNVVSWGWATNGYFSVIGSA